MSITFANKAANGSTLRHIDSLHEYYDLNNVIHSVNPNEIKNNFSSMYTELVSNNYYLIEKQYLEELCHILWYKTFIPYSVLNISL